MGMNFVAMGVAVVVAFVSSTVWYIAFAAQRERLIETESGAPERPPAWMILVELGRGFIVVYVIAVLFRLVGVVGFFGALGLGLLMWVGFPFVLFVGSVMWDRVPWRLATIHAGDWLVKLILVSLIVGLWR